MLNLLDSKVLAIPTWKLQTIIGTRELAIDSHVFNEELDVGQICSSTQRLAMLCVAENLLKPSCCC